MKRLPLTALALALTLFAGIVYGGSIYNYSTTPASNTAIDGTGIQGTNNVSNFDDGLRASLANLKAWVLDMAGENTTGGSANAIEVTPAGGAPTAVEDGMLFAFIATADNSTTSPTMDFGSLGAEPIKKTVGGVETALVAGNIKSGGLYWMRWRASYDSAGGAWELVNPTTLDAGWTYFAAQATTSGTAFDFADIPEWVSEIEIVFFEVSLSASGDILVQIGDGGGIEASGYLSSSDTNASSANSTAGFLIRAGSDGINTSGTMRLSRSSLTGFAWTEMHGTNRGGTGAAGGGSKSLSAALDRVRVTRTSDNFDNGSVAVRYK